MPARPTSTRRRMLSWSASLLGVPLLTGCATALGGFPAGIYRVPSVGGEPVRWIADAARPVVSPVGGRVAWSSERGVFVAPLADGEAVRIGGSDRSGAPAWSPDGRLVTWTDAGSRTITFAGSDGTDARTFPLIPPGLDRGLVALPLRNQPSWAPDGSAVAFVAWDGNGDEVYRIAPDGSDRRRLSSLAASREPVNGERGGSQSKAVADAARPAWSPTGRRIAYAVAPEVGGAPGGVYSVGAQGERQRRLSPRLAGFGPLWSPDGASFAVVQHASEGADLLVYGTASRLPRNLTAGSGLDVLDAAWSPDGDQLAISANGAIHVVDVRSRAVALVADTPLDDRSPAWTPDGSGILFMAIRDLFEQSSMPDIP